MKYNLKTGNYKNIDKFRENIMPPRSYFIPFSSVEAMEATDVRNERYSSDRVRCLSGEWDFIYYKNCLDIPNELDTENCEFDKVAVPSVWQHTGYEEPYYVNTRYQFDPNPPEIPEDCPAGVYRKCFEIESCEDSYYLCFLGVSGGLDLFVNGRYVGYSEGSHNTAQFELNDYIKEGSNELVLVNHKWTNGTYLECQDMFRCNGIFRDVLLYRVKDDSVYDFELKTRAESGGKYSLEIIPSLKLSKPCQLSAFLYDDGELMETRSVNVSPDAVNKLEFEDLSVNEWSAEIPYLYDVIIVLSNDDGMIEVIRRSLGFKNIEINGNVFKFNGEKIKLLGVNHHDTNPKTGYAMTLEDMEKDVRVIKEYNGNCVRTSHYPPDPAFLDFCDIYGIYVVDEADIETHGCETELHKSGICSHNPLWKEHYWDRVYRMYQRDRNHPCVTMWSLGNEAHGYSNQDYCYENLKKLTAVPIHYEAVCRTPRWSYDVVSQMYAPLKICELIAGGRGLPPKYYKKPYYLCEYAHAMGVGAGELERYVKCFYSADNMLGGCIWEFADHAAYHKDGPFEYTYGGDHGEWKHDSNFCVDGLFYPDRTPHSGAYQMKACYRPVRAKRINNTKYSFFNHRYFASADMTVNYKIIENGLEKIGGSFEISVKPQSSVETEIEKFDLNSRLNTVIQFEYVQDDFVIASEEIELSCGKLDSFPTSAKAPKVQESEKKLFVYFDNGDRMIFNRENGCVESYTRKDRELINQVPEGTVKGFGIQLYRAPLDNDMYMCKSWHKYGLQNADSVLKKCEYSLNPDCLKITETVTVKTHAKCRVAVVDLVYSIYADAAVCLEITDRGGFGIYNLPRFGVQLEMPKEFNNVEYFGLGPLVNLPDFKEHALTGIYKTTADEMRENYIKPQESAVRCSVRYAEVTDENGVGFRFEAKNKPFVLSVNPFTPQQCAKAYHKESLPNNTTCINIDESIMGAGSNSCGPGPSPQYKINKVKGRTLSFFIKPIGD